jgi:hypothetical protein
MGAEKRSADCRTVRWWIGLRTVLAPPLGGVTGRRAPVPRGAGESSAVGRCSWGHESGTGRQGQECLRVWQNSRNWAKLLTVADTSGITALPRCYTVCGRTIRRSRASRASRRRVDGTEQPPPHLVDRRHRGELLRGDRCLWCLELQTHRLVQPVWPEQLAGCDVSVYARQRRLGLPGPA